MPYLKLMLNKITLEMMKKIFLLFTAVFMTAGVVCAQDLNSALELANQGNDAFSAGSPELALEAFQQSLKIAEGLGEEGAAHVETCKTAICNIYLTLAKNVYKEKNWDGAVTAFEKAKEVAVQYGNADASAEADELIKSATANKLTGLAAEAKKLKDFATAIEYYKQLVALDPTNAGYAIQLGQTFMSVKDWESAEQNLLFAKDNGQEKNAVKLLARLNLSRCQEALKAKKYQEAVDFANKSNEFAESANAYKLGASAARAMGNLPVCEEMYMKYLEISPNAKDASDIKLTLAASFQKAGNKAKAKEYYQMLVNDPKHGAIAKQQLPTLN